MKLKSDNERLMREVRNYKMQLKQMKKEKDHVVVVPKLRKASI
jgi:hypothetical protein